jgi:hypothetical protein
MESKSASTTVRLLVGVVTTLLACSSAGHSTFEPTGSGAGGDQTGAGGGSASGTGGTSDLKINVGDQPVVEAGAPHPCVNLECQQTTCTLGNCKQKPCAAGTKTTVSGTVYDPAGKVPIYNVIVYVPNADVPALVPGAQCDKCAASAINPVAAAITDTSGHFVLEDVPVGTDIPLVLQVGKWRRQLKLPSVTACSDTALADKEITRLPRNKSEGDIPLIAISVGGADSMECLPLRMGLDPAEFTTEAGAGRVHLYAGHDDPKNNNQKSTKVFDAQHGGDTLTLSPVLWNSLDNLKKYDIVILSCEGNLVEEDRPASAKKALYDYESLGGRVFASHWHRNWFSDGPAPVPQIGTWKDQSDPNNPTPGTIDTSFPKGKAMSEWLVNVGASTTAGMLDIYVPRDNINAVDPKMATSWITLQNPGADPPNTVEFLSYNAPLGAADDMICGRAVFNDLHVSAPVANRAADHPGQPFPASCATGDLSAQEKALEFMLFDLSSCVRKDDQPPEPPAVVH